MDQVLLIFDIIIKASVSYLFLQILYDHPILLKWFQVLHNLFQSLNIGTFSMHNKLTGGILLVAPRSREQSCGSTSSTAQLASLAALFPLLFHLSL